MCSRPCGSDLTLVRQSMTQGVMMGGRWILARQGRRAVFSKTRLLPKASRGGVVVVYPEISRKRIRGLAGLQTYRICLQSQTLTAGIRHILCSVAAQRKYHGVVGLIRLTHYWLIIFLSTQGTQPMGISEYRCLPPCVGAARDVLNYCRFNFF